MRLALLSDIHGNATALEAVLADAESQGGVDAHWVLGDLIALGPDPVRVLERLATLPNLVTTRGNTDRYVTGTLQPPMTECEVHADPSQAALFAEVAATFAWAQGAVSACGWLKWLDTLPLEQRTVLPDGTRLLGVHAAPGTEEGDGIVEGQTDDELAHLLEGCDADLVVVGHTHLPLERTVKNIRVVNLGSVSMHRTADRRACYGLLEANANDYRLERRWVDYDRQAVLDRLETLRHPGRAFLSTFLLDDAAA